MLLKLALAVRPLVLRTEQGPLRPAWSLAHTLLTRAVAAHLTRGHAASAYLRGSFASGEPVYGLSDVDLVIVATPTGREGAARDAIRQRWSRLSRRLPALERLISVAVYEEAELGDAAASSWLTYGLDGRGGEDRAAGLSRRSVTDELGLGLRPELYGPARDWRLLSGRERRPPLLPPTGPERWLPAWLELQWWWRQAFVAVTDPADLSTPYMCLKLVAEPARIWLWVTHGEQVRGHKEALRRTLRRLPEEEAALRLALELRRRLPRSPGPALREALAFLLRMSSRLARQLEEESGHGADVRLLRGDESDLVALAERPASPSANDIRLLPLVDWRALVVPWRPPDEIFTLVEGHPSDPETLSQTGADAERQPHPALTADGLLVFPTADLWGHSLLRAVQCAATDPVSFAVLEQREVARFTDLPGWSARDSARRAVAEHRDWLSAEGPDAAPDLHTLATLLRAVRAALFRESLDADDPELPLSMAATARCLAERRPAARTVAEDSYVGYRAGMLEGRPPDPATVEALRAVVSTLPGYAVK